MFTILLTLIDVKVMSVSKVKLPKDLRDLNSEITCSGDNDEYGLIIWLKTKKESTAYKRAEKIIDFVNYHMDEKES